MNKNDIKKIIKGYKTYNSDEELEKEAVLLFDDYESKNYDFSKFKMDIFTQQNKKRRVYSFKDGSIEKVLSLVLNKELSRIYRIKYPNRNKIIKMLINSLFALKNMNDFVVVRMDFKSFFDSVLSKTVYDKYIDKSVLKREYRDILSEYINAVKYCYAGLPLSNIFTEIICQDFDKKICSVLNDRGLIFYERYVDDFVIILNAYISRDEIINIVNDTIDAIFANCKLKINTSADKLSYISKRDVLSGDKFTFLGYEFIFDSCANHIQYGISEKKIKKYTGQINSIVADYKKNNDVELLRHRIKVFSSRIVIGKRRGVEDYNWISMGLISNYNELRFHMNDLILSTSDFLKNSIYDSFVNNKCEPPYFILQSRKEESIYNLFSTISRNRSIVFDRRIGVSKKTLVKWIKNIDNSYITHGKEYYDIVWDYIKFLKI